MTARGGARPGRVWALALVVAASLGAHAKGLFAPPLDYGYHRQVNTAAIARNYAQKGLPLFSPEIDWEGPDSGRAATEFPLYMWLTGLLWSLGGLGQAWGRILSSLFSAATAVYLYKLLERRLEPDAALCGAVLFSFIPLEVFFGRTIQPEALALLGTTAAVYHWERSLEPGRPLAHWAAAIVMVFLGIAHKLPYGYILLPLAGMTWLRLGKKSLSDWRALAAPALGLGAVYAWYRYASSGVYVVPSKSGEFFAMLEYGRLGEFLKHQFLSRLPELCMTYAGLPLAAVGARELWRRGDRVFALWFGSVALSLAAAGGYAYHHEYTALPFAPVAAAFMGLGAARLWGGARSPRGRAAVAALVLAVPAVSAFRIAHWYRQGNDYVLGAARAAEAVSRPEDAFVGNHRAPSLFLYFLNRKGWSWDLREARGQTRALLQEKIAAGARFYITRKSGLFAERADPEVRWIWESFPLVYDREDLLVFDLSRRSAVSARGRSAVRP